MYSIARASADGEKGESANRLPCFTCLMTVNQLMETVPCMTELKEHVCILDVIADLVLNDSGAVDEPWAKHQPRRQVMYPSNEPICADRRCNVTRDLCITGNVIKPSGEVKGV